MSASQSDLSGQKYGYDLVIAVTQASIHSTMGQYLQKVKEPEVIICYVYDSNNDLLAIDYPTLKINAKGSDPFTVPDGADANTNTDLINLTNANFAGAVKAQIGLPPGFPFKDLPPIVTLGNGAGAPVTFNLFCSEFVVTGFVYGPRGKATWVNKTQAIPTSPSPTPWYFSSDITLDNSTVSATSSSLPATVTARATELTSAVGPDAFSIQQLFLDLTTAMAYTSPTIDGVDKSWPVWALIETIFVGAYFQQLAASGQPVLSYSFSVKNPIQSTLQLGAVSHECSPVIENGQPISSPATTLVYLGTTSTTTPIPVQFAWNWVEPGEVNSFSGVLSTRRGAFLNFLANLLDGDLWICMQPVISFSSSDKGYLIGFSAQRSQTPATFQVIDSPGAPGADGFTDVMTVTFYAPVSADCNGDDLTSIHGEFNYSLNGTVSLGNNNQIRLVMHSVMYMLFSHKEWGVPYTDLGGANYYDKTYTYLFTMGVDQNGHLEVTPTQSLVDNSATFNFQAKGLMGLAGAGDQVQAGLTQTESALSSTLDNVFTNYGGLITAEINGYQGWVFPGADSFISKDVTFSSGLDLITQITYASPS